MDTVIKMTDECMNVRTIKCQSGCSADTTYITTTCLCRDGLQATPTYGPWKRFIQIGAVSCVLGYNCNIRIPRIKIFQTMENSDIYYYSV